MYGQALRIIRICSTEEAKDRGLEWLVGRLREREYSEAIIQAGISKARAVTRHEALKKVEKAGDQDKVRQHHRLVTEFDRRSSPALATILETNYQQIVARDQRLARVFPKPPRPPLREGRMSVSYSAEQGCHLSEG